MSGEASEPRADAESIFTEGAFADAEQAALRAERDRLRAELSCRTEAWRQALRDLSEAEDLIAELRREVAAPSSERLGPADWARITGSDRTPPVLGG